MTLVVADMSKKATEATILGKEYEIYSFSEFAKNNPGLLVWGASNEELTMMESAWSEDEAERFLRTHQAWQLLRA